MFRKYVWFGVAIIGVITIVLYLPLFRGYFQQDEWMAFGDFYLKKDVGLGRYVLSSFIPNVGHWVPFHHLTFAVLFESFGLDYGKWITVSLLWHLLNSVFVFVFARRIFNDVFLGWLTAFLFGIGVPGYQATTWVVADINTHGATFFALLSLILFLDYVRDRSKKKVELIVSIIFLIFSLWFKEIALALFVLFPLIYFLFSKKVNFSRDRVAFFVMGIVGSFYVLLRMVALFFRSRGLEASIVMESQSIFEIILNMILFPVKVLAQTVVHSTWLMSLSLFVASKLPDDWTGLPGTTAYAQYVEQTILLIFDFAVFMFFLLLVLILVWRRNGVYRNVVFFAFSFVILNSLVYVMSPERSASIPVVDSRNLYFPYVGTAILLVSLVNVFLRKNRLWLVVVLIPIFVLNVVGLKKEVDRAAVDGTVRKNILDVIYGNYPKLPENVVFYTESDSSYYGLPEMERIMPFQSGFGQTLLVWYQGEEQFPPGFFQDKFLWGITDQGYQEYGGRGFGYFRDFDLLADAISENNLSYESVVSFSYDSKLQKLIDNTLEVGGRLEGYFARGRELGVGSYAIDVLENKGDTFRMDDRDRSTFWSSKLPYGYNQEVTLKFDSERTIAGLKIDSYNNLDQNRVGYRIEVSEDGLGWERVFEAKRYPPNKDGFVNLSIKPSILKWLRIVQIGDHKFAPWVIHELYVYEKIN